MLLLISILFCSMSFWVIVLMIPTLGNSDFDQGRVGLVYVIGAIVFIYSSSYIYFNFEKDTNIIEMSRYEKLKAKYEK